MGDFFKVKFPTKRKVFVDDAPQLDTNVTTPIETGMHTFDLGDPHDYTPPSQDVSISGTTRKHPRIIKFEPIASPAKKVATKVGKVAAKKVATKAAKKSAKKVAKKGAKRAS